MTEPPLSELYAECETALSLYRFMRKAYSNLIDNCPEGLSPHIREVNVYLYAELQRTLEDELTGQDTYALCALVEGLKEDRGGKLW
jgi:hypothetical protein